MLVSIVAVPIYVPAKSAGRFPFCTSSPSIWTDHHKCLQIINPMYGCELDCEESWAPKNLLPFELWCWRRLLRVPWTARRSNQSILKEISPGCSLEGLMLKLKLLLWPPDVKIWLIGKAPDAGRDWGQEEKGMTEDEMVGWHHRLDGHEFE